MFDYLSNYFGNSCVLTYFFCQSPPVSASEMWTLLYRCFPDVRKIGMCSTQINDASNAITMCSYLHEGFGDFSLTLMPTVCYNPSLFSSYSSFTNIVYYARRILTFIN